MKRNLLFTSCVCFVILCTVAIFSCSKQAQEKVKSSNTSLSTTVVNACSCGTTLTGSFTGPGYQYTDDTLNLSCAASKPNIKIACSYSDVNSPCKFTIYDNGSLITTGWLGVAPCGGPWGLTNLNNPVTNYTLSFTYTSGHLYRLRVETGMITNCTHQSVNWSAKVTCKAAP